MRPVAIMHADLRTPLLTSPASSCSQFQHQDEGGTVISIIGTGDFSRSLAIRLVASGFRVVVGSRNPGRVVRDLFPDAVQVRSQREAADAAEKVVFLAVYPEFYGSLEHLKEQLAGKVLVDVSNAARLKTGEASNAEKLAERFPESRVVKGFNVVSAWTLQTGAPDGSRQVLVCSSCSDSKALVVQLARRLGFSPVDMGGLGASRDIENAPLLLFPFWERPVLTTFLLLLFFYGYAFIRDVLLPYIDRGENNFHQLPFVTVNQVLPAVALVTLALVYLPGLLAAGFQLFRGTKYSRFPGWLDGWMRRRKQLGLLSFLCAGLHALYSMSPRRGAERGVLGAAVQQVKAGGDGSQWEQTMWRSDLYLSSGILGFGVLTLLAVTSLPSVGNALNWREFTFVQSGLGYAAVALSTVHTLLFGWDSAFLPATYLYHLPPLYLLALVLPCILLVGRLVLLLPCLESRLAKIRRGWESRVHRDPREAAGSDPQPSWDA